MIQCRGKVSDKVREDFEQVGNAAEPAIVSDLAGLRKENYSLSGRLRNREITAEMREDQLTRHIDLPRRTRATG